MGDIKTNIKKYYQFEKQIDNCSFGLIIKGSKKRKKEGPDNLVEEDKNKEKVLIREINKSFINEINKDGKKDENYIFQQIGELLKPDKIEKFIDIFKGKDSYFVVSEYLKITKYYQIGKQLGDGTFGNIYEGIEKSTGKKVAIKIIDKSKLKNKENIEDSFNKEVNILKELEHPHIVKYYEFYKGISSYYIVMEHLEGGELFDLIIERYNNKDSTKNKLFTEEEIRHIFKQILSAIEFCHGNLIAHRDLNFQNIL